MQRPNCTKLKTLRRAELNPEANPKVNLLS
jgi:hypothetical protein